MPTDERTRLSMPALALGVRLNDTYEIDAHVATGGMGNVYRGHNIETGEPVAIKTMLPELARDEAVFALFKKEATLLGRLRHDTIVHYYSFSRDPTIGLPYLAMEFVEGQALSDRIAAGALDAREAITLFMRVAEGLAVAHEVGVVHRDLSPDNIILSNGDVRHPRIIDFGIARSLKTGEGTLIGSNFAGKFNFVSPEQLGMGTGEVTTRSDIYSLALVMAAALRGAPLDMGGTHVAVIEKRHSVPDLAGVDQGLSPLLTWMLAPDPTNRPGHMTEVVEWLREHLAGRPPTVPLRAAAQATVLQSGEPAQAYELPFGAGPILVASPLVTAVEVARRRSGAGFAAGVALAVAAGIGAAYLGGLFDRRGEETVAAVVGSNASDSAQPAASPGSSATGTDKPPVATVQPPQAANTVQAPTAETKSPAIGTATVPNAETAERPAETPPTTVPQAQPSGLEAQPSVPPGSDVPPKADRSPAARDLAEGGLAQPSQLTEPAIGTAPAAAVDRGSSKPGTSTDTSGHGAVQARTDTAILGVEPVAGDCFFATVSEMENGMLSVRGLAQTHALFDAIGKSVMDAGPKAPLIEGSDVSAAQCPAVDFLETVHPFAEPGARLTLSPELPVVGATLRAKVAGAGARPVRLLSVDTEGLVRLLGAASKGDAEGNADIEVPLDPRNFKPELAYLILALVGDLPLGTAEGRAADYFPALVGTLTQSREEFALDFSYLRLATAHSVAVQGAPAFEPVEYAQGSIRPNHVSQEELDRALVEFYQGWKKLYLVAECGEGRIFARVNADGKAEADADNPKSMTSSEAHGFAMVATLLMAAADPDAQSIFDGLYRFRADHPARSDSNLMAWSQVEGCANAGEEVGGDNTATDGDLEMAYALLLADNVWGSSGAIDYRGAALAAIAAILEHEMSPSGDFPLLGDWAATADEKHYRTTMRSSDLMPAYVKAFADASGEKRWVAVRDRGYAIIEAITRKFSRATGLMPDYVADADKNPKPARANLVESETDGDFASNAARYPWRIGLDFLLYGEPRARDTLGTLNTWIRGKVKDQPDAIADTYRLDGEVPPDTGTGSLTLISLFGVAAMIDAQNQKWLNAIWDNIAEQKLEDDDFHGNTLKLMAMIVMSGHWAKL